MLLTGYGPIKHQESCSSKFDSGEYLKIPAITILYPPHKLVMQNPSDNWINNRPEYKPLGAYKIEIVLR